jgi:hypothetical protein
MALLKRYIHTTVPFSAVIEYVDAFFMEHPEMHLRSVGPARAAIDVQHRLVDDVSDTARLHEAITLSWRPKLRLFPNFDGFVSVRPHFKGSMLAIEGTYDPPFGSFGRAFDGFAGRMLAVASLDYLLRRIRADIEKRHAAFVKSCPTIEQLNKRRDAPAK